MHVPLLLLLLLVELNLTGACATITINADDTPVHQQFSNILHSKIEQQQLQLHLPLQRTIGPKALNSALTIQKKTPILALLITQNEFQAATEKRAVSPISAIFREQPLQRLITLTKIATPSIHHLGLLTTQPHTLPSISSPIVIQQPAPQLRQALNTLLPKVDALLTHHDPKLFNPDSIRNILLSSYRQQKPLICHTQALVTAGCIMGVHSSATELIKESLDWIQYYQNHGENHPLQPPRHSRHFSVSINNRVAQSLGFRLTHPSKLTQQLQELEDE